MAKAGADLCLPGICKDKIGHNKKVRKENSSMTHKPTFPVKHIHDQLKEPAVFNIITLQQASKLKRVFFTFNMN